jgi:hypothetical protein
MTTPPDPSSGASDPAGSGAPQYGQPPHAQPPYGQPPYGQQWGGYPPYPQPQGTNGFAIASLVCAFLCWPLGLVFGFIARSQITRTGEGGSGLALAGLIISGLALIATIIWVVLVIVVVHNCNTGAYNCVGNNSLGTLLPLWH